MCFDLGCFISSSFPFSVLKTGDRACGQLCGLLSKELGEVSWLLTAATQCPWTPTCVLAESQLQLPVDVLGKQWRRPKCLCPARVGDLARAPGVSLAQLGSEPAERRASSVLCPVKAEWQGEGEKHTLFICWFTPLLPGFSQKL